MPPPEALDLSSALSGETLLEAAAMVLGFIALLFVAALLLPGRRVTGPDADGNERVYKLNGLALFLIALIVACLGQGLGWFSLSLLHTHLLALFVVANGFAFGLSGWLYLRGMRRPGAPPGSWRGFFFGVDAAPSWLGWTSSSSATAPRSSARALHASFAAVQYETYGELTLGMMLYQTFTFLYVLNYFQFEQGMIHTWDIVRERFGWMLVWATTCWCPSSTASPAGGWFTRRSRCRRRRRRDRRALPLRLLALPRRQPAKHRFKRDPAVTIWGQPARTLDGRLLVSGFWGIGRHLNYSGEICIYLAFALTTGLTSWAPFLLPAWLAGLLWHRSRRDERRCRAKYGALWERYTQRARFAMLPFIY